MDFIGKYQVQKLVRTSSYSDLYLCYDPDLEMQVALKLFVFRRDETDPDQRIEQTAFWQKRFIQEARLMGRLDHPNIISIRELSFNDEGMPYLVMPFVEANLRFEIGRDIEVPLSEYKGDPNDPLYPKRPSLRRTMDILIGLADALSYLHQNHFVHRDIKPGNVLLTRRQGGWPKICDFGFTFRVGSGDPDHKFWLGTENYLSPEQARYADRVSPASDVYSLGVLAYRLLAGALPVDPYPKLSDLDPHLHPRLIRLIEAMMSEDSMDRPQNARLVLSELKQIDPQIGRKKIRLKDTSKTVLTLGRKRIK